MTKYKPIIASCLTLLIGSYSDLTFADPYQQIMEAEQVSGGTIQSDLMASGNKAVTRTTDGTYTWWIIPTSAMTTGSYSLYVRVALAPGASPGRNFGAGVFYNETAIASPSVVISNKAYKWMRVGSFNLSQVGANLRVSDWSALGLSVDKLAIVKDVTVEAEQVAGGTIISDSTASGAQAVNRTTGGNYIWWLPLQSVMIPGDYDVWVRAKSTSSTAHNFSGYLVLENTANSISNSSIAGGNYQWYNVNRFTYAGGSQAVRFSDYSEAGLNVDSITLTRVTPFDKDSSAQTLFSGGEAVLAPAEIVTFRGTAIGSQSQGIGRISVVRANETTLYAYFRQRITSYTGFRNNDSNQPYEAYQINMAKSTDNGASFDILPQTIVPVTSDANGNNRDPNGLGTAYDPQVTRTPSGYRMVFEGVGLGCNASVMTAFSPDGINNWIVQTPPVCSHLLGDGSASVPTYFADVESGDNYLQFVSASSTGEIATKHQWTMPSGGFGYGTLTLNSTSQLPIALPQGTSTSWESKNFGAGNISYEDGYYYHIYEGGNWYNCEAKGYWGIGIGRTSTPAVPSSLTKSIKNPFMLAPAMGCAIEYPQIVTLPTGTYLYYWQGWQYSDVSKTLFRRRINIR